jgi:hypothetical protein
MAKMRVLPLAVLLPALACTRPAPLNPYCLPDPEVVSRGVECREDPGIAPGPTEATPDRAP